MQMCCHCGIVVSLPPEMAGREVRWKIQTTEYLCYVFVAFDDSKILFYK